VRLRAADAPSSDRPQPRSGAQLADGTVVRTRCERLPGVGLGRGVSLIGTTWFLQQRADDGNHPCELEPLKKCKDLIKP